MFTLAFLKPILQFTGALCFRACIQPPNPAPSSNDKVYIHTLFDKFCRSLSLFMRLLVACLFMCQISALIAVAHPPLGNSPQGGKILHAICPSLPPNPSSLLSCSPLFIVGIVLVSFGTSLRLWSYNALGSLFTFENTMKPEHVLITSGPYRYIRHPGYTSLGLAFLGASFMLLEDQGWVRQCGVMSSPLGVGVVLWASIGFYVFYCLVQRGYTEDKNLKDRFGYVWEEYAREVRYKALPGIY